MIATLPIVPRTVVVLRYQEDLMPEEIAAVLAMPVSHGEEPSAAGLESATREGASACATERLNLLLCRHITPNPNEVDENEVKELEDQLRHALKREAAPASLAPAVEARMNTPDAPRSAPTRSTTDARTIRAAFMESGGG